MNGNETVARVTKHAGEYELCVTEQNDDTRLSHKDYKLTVQELRDLKNSIDRLLEV
jgi:hypothetical protein